MKEAFEKIRNRMKEETEFLSDCTKYGNKDAEQQKKSYSTAFLYEIAELVENLIDIVSEVEAEYINTSSDCSTNAERIRAMSDEELAQHFSELIRNTEEYEYCKDASDWLKWLKLPTG